MHSTFSNTQRETFNSCKRKYFYKYSVGLEEGVGIEAQFSKICIHPLIQAMYVEASRGEEGWKQFIDKVWGEFTNTVGSLSVLNTPECNRAVLDVVVKYLRPLIQERREEGWKCVGVEVTGEAENFKVGGSVYKSRVDVVEERGEEREIIEVKFTKRQREKPWAIDNQVVGHAVCFNTRDVTILEVVSERPTRAKKAKVTILRHPYRIMPDIIKEWEEETYVDMKALEAHWDGGVWPKNTKSCYDWNRPCPFMPLCEAGTLREGMYDSYEKRVWDGPPSSVGEKER